MPNVEKQRDRLISLLKELFQLDQPDLDFGFYRIMHAKAGQVTKFLENDLLGIIREAFGEADGARVEQAKAAYEAARQQAIEYGAPDPDATEPVKKAKAAWDAAKESGSNEGDVYDHLYRFFERYYDNGDFMSRRYFARETDGKAAPYAVPYDGREVYLHWANRDQYYIKTSEYLTNFTFDPTQAKEFKQHHGELFAEKPLKVHCCIVSASEGEHNNVKASEQTERYFIIHEPEPVKLEIGETGEPELVIQFQYRADPEKTGQEGTWRKKRLDEAAETVKSRLPELNGAGDYVTALMTPAPTEAEKDRTLLEKYLFKYTARNTMDYFIHKDLGGFLRRELDFYIKNEVMRLDDIESADAPRVEAYLAKIKVLRRIAHYLIDFLAQLEDFQKKLWLKKKFVVDTQYCITLDRIPEEFYPEIAANEAQREEWVRLLAIDSIDGYSEPLTVDFLKANQAALVDTGLFSDDFRDRLLSDLDELDETTDGSLIFSENFQALSASIQKYAGLIDLIYYDPPYNTDAIPIVYKNGYKSSSWASLMQDRIKIGHDLLNQNGVAAFAIDDAELVTLDYVIRGSLKNRDIYRCIVEHYPGSGTGRSNVSRTHEYCLFSVPKNLDVLRGEAVEDGERIRGFRRAGTGDNNFRIGNPGRPESFFAVLVDPEEFEVVGAEPPPAIGQPYPKEPTDEGYVRVYPIGEDGAERVWSLSYLGAVDAIRDGKIISSDKFVIKRIFEDKDRRLLLQSIWSGKEYNATTGGTNVLSAMFGSSGEFSYPKSVGTMERVLDASLHSVQRPTVFDAFAGSGTTIHAIHSRQRKSGKKTRYILSEMGAYTETVLKNRAIKSAYSSRWVDGKPSVIDGLSHAFKYIRLESYEDALNSLKLKPSADLAHAGTDFARDYMLRYWLDFETKGSPSLLNIEWFDDPTAYKLKIKKPGTDEYVEKAVDLVETFNWLIGLHVEHLDRWRGYDAAFKREVDPELPGDTNTRLMLDGALKETDDGAWRFRKVEGYTLRTPGDHNDREKALVVWRKLTGDLEQDNLMLDEWFRKYRLSAQDTEFDVIYVNGSNNLPNLRQAEETWKVRLIEEAFHQAMWDVEG